MLSIGKFNTLKVKEATPVGYILAATFEDESQQLDKPSNPWTENIEKQTQTILLSDATRALNEGESIDVFLFYAQDKSVQATMQNVKIEMDEFKSLTVVGITEAGAFLDWGLSRDLFAPKQHIHSELAEGLPAVVKLVHEPKQNRLYATTKIEQYLETAPSQWDYAKPVELLVYSKTPLGYKVLIDQQYAGLLYSSDLFKSIRIGETHKGFITKIRDDGKIDVSLQRHDAKQRQTLAEQIIEDLEAHGGISSLTDKSSPQDIQTRFNVSKGAYKKALGQLYKNKKILISATHITLEKAKP